MAVFAIGDIQGCFDELTQLLVAIQFNLSRDHLWFVGDLVNRGPQSLETLRYVKSLGNQATTVLGNHDLHLLAAYLGVRPRNSSPELHPVLDAPDCEVLIDWLRCRPLLVHDKNLKMVLVHSGILPTWTLDDALKRAHEVESVLQSKNYAEFIHHLYGDQPNYWHADLRGWDRLRAITNVFTRMRYCTPASELNFEDVGPLGTQQQGYIPWFKIESRKCQEVTIVFGHWSTLGYYQNKNVVCVDSGCLWGKKLTAVRLDCDPIHPIQIPCQAKRIAKRN